MNKKVYLKYWGCQMNARDSEAVKGMLLAQGYCLVQDQDEADIVLYNTCSVRQHAEDRVWSAIGKFKSHKPYAMSHKPIIGIIGCMAQNYKEEIFKRAPGVDLVVGPSHIDNIALYLGEVLRGARQIVAVGDKRRKETIYASGHHDNTRHACVVISEGCENFCSYCVVPFVRGKLKHRPLDAILGEIEAAVRSGISEITLLGQNVNSYKSQVNFTDLLEKACQVKGLESVSFLTCHPKDTTRDLFELMNDIPVIKKHLHMPLQSGSDRILKLMNRGYTSKKYMRLVGEYRKIVYNGKLSTDLIAGFPTETDGDFEKTFDLAGRIGFDAAYIFKYSPRPHTKAAKLADDVPKAVKETRHARLLELQKKISKKKKRH